MCKSLHILELSKKTNTDITAIRNWIKQNQFPTLKKGNRHYATSKTIKYSKFIREHRNVIQNYRDTIVLTITNNKGGVQKTTTTVTLASMFSEWGLKVLLIDFDGQGNASNYSLPFETDENGLIVYPEVSLKDLLLLQKKTKITQELLKKSILHSPLGFDIITNNILFNNVRSELESAPAKELLPKKMIEFIKNNTNEYDYILIDTPPTLAFEQMNAYFASDYLLIVSNADTFSRAGIEQTVELIKRAREQNEIYANPKPMELIGVLLTDVQPETNVDRYNIEKISEFCKEENIPLLEDVIRSTVKVREAIEIAEPLHRYAPTSPAACGYYNVALEINMLIKKDIVKKSLGL